MDVATLPESRNRVRPTSMGGADLQFALGIDGLRHRSALLQVDELLWRHCRLLALLNTCLRVRPLQRGCVAARLLEECLLLAGREEVVQVGGEALSLRVLDCRAEGLVAVLVERLLHQRAQEPRQAAPPEPEHCDSLTFKRENSDHVAADDVAFERRLKPRGQLRSPAWEQRVRAQPAVWPTTMRDTQRLFQPMWSHPAFANARPRQQPLAPRSFPVGAGRRRSRCGLGLGGWVFGRDARVVAVSQARLSVSAAAQARHSLPFVRVHGWQALLRWVGEWRGSQRSNLGTSERRGLLGERRTMKFVPPTLCCGLLSSRLVRLRWRHSPVALRGWMRCERDDRLGEASLESIFVPPLHRCGAELVRLCDVVSMAGLCRRGSRKMVMSDALGTRALACVCKKLSPPIQAPPAAPFASLSWLGSTE